LSSHLLLMFTFIFILLVKPNPSFLMAKSNPARRSQNTSFDIFLLSITFILFGEVESCATKLKYIIRHVFTCKWILLRYFYIFAFQSSGLSFFWTELIFPTVAPREWRPTPKVWDSWIFEFLKRSQKNVVPNFGVGRLW
jgi:hypothetical protein